MKEQFVSFETAILAKEKGFNVETLHFYCKNRTCDYIKTPYKYSFEVNANQERLINGEIDNFGYGITWSAPTQSLLQRWLREVHDIFVSINTTSEFRWLSDDEGDQEYLPVHQFRIIKNKDNYKYDVIDWSSKYDIYEDALEKGLQEALKLIK